MLKGVLAGPLYKQLLLKMNKRLPTFNSTPAGKTIGRNDKECGQIGVSTIPGTLGWTNDAPADIE